jgi:4-diphosphocytidyl-2-C-methyl-D-erythritol kinase
MTRIDETAFAKINIDLRICGRRTDGYHDLDSLVVFADFGDELSFSPADELTLTIDGPFANELSNDDDNLVRRAARALARRAGREPLAHIHLEKHLPVAAGIGGGSADAAATLRGLARLWELPLSHSDLHPLARMLGADVPVCLGSSAVRMQGIGDMLTPLSFKAGLPLLLVNPGQAVPTADVFRALESISGARTSSLDDTPGQDLRDYLRYSVNDLEPAAIRIEPIIENVLDALRAEPGCDFARMSGSGATCFGVFDEPASRDQALARLSARHAGWWVTATDIQ